MKKNGSWDSKLDPFGDFTIIFEAANNNFKILNYPVRYYARQSGSPNISRWIDGLKLLRVCWFYMISELWFPLEIVNIVNDFTMLEKIFLFI